MHKDQNDSEKFMTTIIASWEQVWEQTWIEKHFPFASPGSTRIVPFHAHLPFHITYLPTQI